MLHSFNQNKVILMYVMYSKMQNQTISHWKKVVTKAWDKME